MIMPIEELLLGLFVGVSATALLIYCVGYLPDKFPAFRKWEFERCANLVAATQANNMTVPFGYTKDMYHNAYEKMLEYLDDNGIKEVEVPDAFGKVHTIKRAKVVERNEHPTIRVRKTLESMDYTDEQIARIFRKAVVVHGRQIQENYDELLWFTLNELSNV